jgi:hypothetical protein
MRTIKLLTLVMSVALTACGGGGGGGATGPVASSNTFDIQSGWTRLVSTGYTKTLTISGSCAGTFVITESAATSGSTFENAAALSNNTVTNMTLTNCTPASTVDTEVTYYDSNYRPLGYSAGGGDYAVWSGIAALPTAAKVGDIATVGSADRYTNSTKSTSAGRQDATLVMEADTATSAIANLVIKYYSAAPYNRLDQTIQRRFRVAADNSLTLISVDVQFANGDQAHLIMN